MGAHAACRCNPAALHISLTRCSAAHLVAWQRNTLAVAPPRKPLQRVRTALQVGLWPAQLLDVRGGDIMTIDPAVCKHILKTEHMTWNKPDGAVCR